MGSRVASSPYCHRYHGPDSPQGSLRVSTAVHASVSNKANFPKLLIVAASTLAKIEVSAKYCVIQIGETFRSRSTEKPKAVSSAAETRFLQAEKVIFLRKSQSANFPKLKKPLSQRKKK
ncbi:hypothetical protein H112_04690 [Trichophyton rubrum D6]|uniref:Uncharacterized protein n=2 Tax=Trichophyton TaxID=5550 RepID=A0A022W1S2_TRIRU|nr:hypothetical protein H100_04698 [Trichophyton rubrum MR850]EZF41366.1 hypothetical protein H102_04686 [Trichophyton rubrum CBS 100081]EZF52287.1 hypothetical protein H103_04691 [Trichophyton rubrum CBS 288.86]EZF62779.1 hypothetical protein H104_04677 [Trichophyton rubrum CBS 289.86]EZF73408.1 hypothetical protein H105_04707 [Trichophyton soudanense CBS 452.61]EZF84093.1 hypothetical protein H110_04687 [Trichophyton rubrum MR1448]EZG16335.1 hypothetical protein H107_04817 [Trichophyton rub